ncbi:hypothetical protein JZ751_029831, partial [Albula glossodonta]
MSQSIEQLLFKRNEVEQFYRRWTQEEEGNHAPMAEEQEEGKAETEEEQMSERQGNMEAGSSGDGVSGPLLSVQRHGHIDMPLCPPNSFHRGRCGICEMFEDSAHWTLLEPCTFRENDICRYRFTSPPGRYECQESGLRWVCVVEVSLQYHYCSWENFEEQRNSMRCTEGGPLLDITVTAGPDPSLSDRVKVLHVTDSGVSLVRVCEVSRFHVKILQPTFSPMGVVVEKFMSLIQRISIFGGIIEGEKILRPVPSVLPAAVRFVDDHRAELIQRVSLVEPIADALKPLIQDEAYSIICAENTSQKQMRMLYRFLDSGGPIVKSAFYTVLFQKEKLLVGSRDSDHEIQHGGYLFITETLFPYLSPPPPLSLCPGGVLCGKVQAAQWVLGSSSCGAAAQWVLGSSSCGAAAQWVLGSSSCGAAAQWVLGSSSCGAAAQWVLGSSSCGAAAQWVLGSSSCGAAAQW